MLIAHLLGHLSRSPPGRRLGVIPLAPAIVTPRGRPGQPGSGAPRRSQQSRPAPAVPIAQPGGSADEIITKSRWLE
jgi:hypothetical protein